MKDRAMQALHLLALDPVVETTADKNSYGFRQQRSCADAIAQCFTTLSHAPNTQWILEGDIKACFDEIDHTALMDRLRVRIKDKRTCALVKAFLKAGVMTELGDREETHTGTPQGGLCNALHKPPYEQCRVMRSAGLLALVTATLALERCA